MPTIQLSALLLRSSESHWDQALAATLGNSPPRADLTLSPADWIRDRTAAISGRLFNAFLTREFVSSGSFSDIEGEETTSAGSGISSGVIDLVRRRSRPAWSLRAPVRAATRWS